jgi:tripartite-type tricarboxylate transporter receptor subunit TctC
MVVPAFAERIGATVVIDNKPGANGILASDIVAKSPPDGNTLLLGGSSSIAINPGIYKSLPYDPVKDLLPVVRSGSLPFLLIANANVPANNVPELIAYAKANPGKLAYATPQSSSLMGMELFKRTAGVDILSVPYKSSPQAVLDMIANQVQVMIADYGTAIPHVKAGKVKVLAVTMAKRTALMPDVATVDETLKSGFDISAWNGLLAPGGTPMPVAVRISDAWQGALALKEVQDRLAGIGFDVSPMGPDQFGPYVREQIETWGKLARDAGVKAE